MEVGISEEQLHQQGSDFTGMEVWDREWSGHLSFDANGLIIENHRLEALLMARVVERGIPIRWSVQIRDSKVTEDAAWLDVDSGEQLESALLVGADGAESRVRSILGFRRSIGTTSSKRLSRSFAARFPTIRWRGNGLPQPAH